MMPALQAGRGGSTPLSSTRLFIGDVAQLDIKERRSSTPDDKGSTPFIASKFHAGMEQGWLDGLISRATAGSTPAPATFYSHNARR